MTAVRGFRNWRGWRKVAWLVFGVVFCLAALIVFFPNSLLNQRVAAGLTDYLVKQLGPEAICAEVELGWRHVSIKDILLPLDKHGTMLYIARIDATIDPLIAISQPGAYERSISTINVVEPRLQLHLPEKKEQGNSSGLVPSSVFKTLAQIDSLRSFTFEDGKIEILKNDTTLFSLFDIQGGLKNANGKFHLIAGGEARTPVKVDFRVTGELVPAEQHLNLTTTAESNETEFAIQRPPFDTIAINAGRAELSVQQDSSEVKISGNFDLNELELRILGQSVFVPDAQFVLNKDIISWDSMEIRTAGVEAQSSGKVGIRDSLRIESNLIAQIDFGIVLKAFGVADSGIVGQAQLSSTIGGTLLKPTVSVTLHSDSIRAMGETARAIIVYADLRDRFVSVSGCSLTTSYGDLRARGELELAKGYPVELQGEFRPSAAPKLFGQSTAIDVTEFAAEGVIRSPHLRWLVRDSSATLLGNGTAVQDSGGWTFAFSNPAGKTGSISILTNDGAWQVSASNAHILVPIAFPTTTASLASVKQFEFGFTGDQNSGASKLTVTSDSLRGSVVARVLRQLEFDGNYHRDIDGVLDLNGSWYGLSGEGEEFFGQGNIKVSNNLVTIENLYVDEAGSLTGTVRIDTPSVDLSMSIEQLPLSRLPIVASVADKWKLAGVVSGEVSASGPVDALQWYADISLVEGVAQGVPGYWGLLTAEGRNDRIESLFSSFGRGVRSIFEASGSLDISQNTIDMRADFPASDCADFIQALSGRTGILSGNLDGEVLVFGKLSAPDVVASMRVAHGELLGELTVDKFSLDATVGTEADGKRTLAVPQLSFYKENEYSFTGELTAEPTKGGPFRAYFEGSGDFLDLLQQVDADFTSLGSDSRLRVEVGGTWDAPKFVGGELIVREGEFTYPPAAPGTLTMNMLLHLNSEGLVDTGRIQVDAGPDNIRLEFLGTDDPRVGMLTPLVIPKPRIELGILYLSSSDNGIAVRLPGFMKPEWLGRLTTGANEYSGITISAFGDTRLRIGGEVLMRDARFTFPFFSYGGGRIRPVTKWLVDRLYEAEWDLDITMGNGSHYDVEITGFKDSDLFAQIGDNVLLNTVAEYLDHISVDAIVSPTETPLVMEGALVDSSLRLYGKLSASSGKADYLDQTFWIEKLQAEFDETDIFPIISGRSATYGVDSVGRTVPVYLTIYEIDPESNTRVPYGRFEEVTYVLEADGYPDQEQVLALLGYDLTNFSQGKAEQLLTRTAMTAAKRIWLDPISRRLERATFFDEISLAPGGGVSASIFRQQRESVLRDTLESSGVVRFLKGSNVTVGKYFTKDIFVTYTGELAEAAGEIEGGRLGLIHYWNLQYRVVPLSPDFVLDFAVEYDEASRRRDESVALKYSFVLEP